MVKRRTIVVALAFVMGLQLLLRADAPSPATSRPVGAQRAAAPKKYPDKKLVEACRTQARRLKGKLDETFSIVTAPPFVVAGNLPERTLRIYAQHSVIRPAKAMWTRYFDKKPTEAITVLLFADAKSYKAWAKKLYGDKDLPHFGYYRPGIQTMVMNIATGTGTLVHELTHALLAFDFPAVPTWFNEGFGSLHEQCSVGEDNITGLVNWRLPGLLKQIRLGRLRSLRDLVTRRDFYGPRQGINYAQARYFVMYMQTRGLLKKFYVRLRAKHTGRGSDVAAIEHVFGKKIEAVEKDYLAWAGKLRWPPK